jgi:inosine/xanthosine triphosphatase
MGNMKVGVGSKNPVKINAVRTVFEEMIGGDIKIYGMEVDSGVSDQPMNIDSSYQGALGRAESVFKKKKVDYAVGLEGGVNEFSFGWFTFGVIVILNDNGDKGVGISPALPLEEKVIKRLKEGEELGDVLEGRSGINNVKQKQGAFGLYTKGFVSRQKGYEQGVAFALSKFVKKELNNGGK